MSLRELAASVREARTSATAVVRETLAKIQAENGAINAFTAVTEERALAAAAAVDAAVAAGRDPGPLAGAPFAVKNLYDVAGLPTIAGSRIDRDRAPAARDAALVRRLEEAGAVLVGALNMDEYAYGFSTENTHYGATRNPHDRTRVAGGSSGGSAAAVAASLIPLSVGSDSNGSIRVPAALCGVFGLRPTYGRLSRSGMRLFSASLDVGGPFARSAEDLAIAYDALQGCDPNDAACAVRPPEPVSPGLKQGLGGLRHRGRRRVFRQSGSTRSVRRGRARRRRARRLQAGRTARRRRRARLRDGRDLGRRRGAASARPDRESRRLRSQDPRALPRRSAGARRLVRACATPSPLVVRSARRGFQERRRDPGACDALSRVSHRSGVGGDRWRATAGGRPSRRLHAAALLRRPAHGRRAGRVDGSSAAGRADRRRALARRPGLSGRRRRRGAGRSLAPVTSSRVPPMG